MEGIVSARGDFRGRNGPALLVIAITCAAAAASLAVVWPSLSYPLILGALGVAGLLLATRRLYLFLVGFVIFMFFEGMIKNGYPYALTFFLRDIFLAVIYLVWFVKYPLSRGFRGRYDKPISITVGAFVFYTLIMTIIPFTDEPLLYRLGGARWWLANIPLFFVGADVINSRPKFDRLCYVFLGVAAATGIYGVIQYWVGFDHLYAISPHYKNIAAFGQWHGIAVAQALRRRVFSTFGMPSGLAGAMLPACLLGVAYSAHVKNLKLKILLATLVAIFFAALVFTGCRSAYVPLAITLAVYAAAERRKKQVAAVTLALAAGFAVVIFMSKGLYLYRLGLIVTDYQYTLDRVCYPWREGYQAVAGNFFGLGITKAAKVGRIWVDSGLGPTFWLPENGYAQALVSLGWPGLFAFSGILFVIPFRLGLLGFLNRAENWRVLILFALWFANIFVTLLAPLYSGVGPVMYWLLAGSVTSIYVKRGLRSGEVGLRMRGRP